MEEQAGLKPETAVASNQDGAKAIYSRLESLRYMSLQRARNCSALTLPGLIPPIYANENTELPTPYQSVGARGVNNLASKLLMALLPPGSPFFRLQIRRSVAAKLGEQLSAIQSNLEDIEQTVNDAVEMNHTRPTLAEVLKNLIVAGNAMLNVPSHKDMRMFRMDQYVISRDSMGRPMQAVILETTVASALKDEVKVACKVEGGDPFLKVDVYTKIIWNYVTNR